MLACNATTFRIFVRKASFPCLILFILHLVVVCLLLVVASTNRAQQYQSEQTAQSSPPYPYGYDEGTTTTSTSGNLRGGYEEEEVKNPSFMDRDGSNYNEESAIDLSQEQPTSTSYFETATRTMYNHEIFLCDGNSSEGKVCAADSECPYDTRCTPVALDPFHLRKLYPSDGYNIENDWYDSWSYTSFLEEIIAGPSQSDPRVTFFGNEDFMEIPETRHELVFDGSSSNNVMDSVFGLLVSSNYPQGIGFDDVEFTVYVKANPSERKQLVTLWARANNYEEGHLNCNSFLGYLASWDLSSGDIKFQKHFGGGVATDFIVSPNKIIPRKEEEDQKWIGMKFVVSTLPNSQDVHLELYIDEREGMNGGVWNLIHTFVDRPNEWMAASDERGHISENFSNEDCSTEVIPDGSTILGPTHGCALEFMGYTKVSFKNVSIRNIQKKEQFFCNDHPHIGIPCQTDNDCMDHAGSTCHEIGMDRFGVKELFKHSDLADATLLDWTSSWDVPYVGKPLTDLVQPGNQDPYDPRTTHRGIGTIALLPEGEIHMREKSRLFISKPMRSDIKGWDNVEFTAYGKILQDGSVSPTSGLEMVVRSNYDAHDGCTASAYVARLHRATGQASFQKLYFDHPDHGKIETVSRRSEPLKEMEGGLPKDVWIGMKFVVFTYPESDGAVQLDLYVDMNHGKYGGDWKLVHTTVDYPGTWMATWKQTHPWKDQDPKDFDHMKTVSDICSGTVQDGDTILGPKNECFLMVNGSPNTIVAWKHASIRSILPASPHSV